MLKVYNKSLFGERINPNSAAVSLLATNLYEKLKVKGILPEYIKRSKAISHFKVSHTGGLTIDKDFTFERSVTDSLAIDSEINIGKIHTIEYEVKFTESTTITYSTSSSNYIVFPAILSGFHKIKLVRENIKVTLFVDGNEFDTANLAINEDQVYSSEVFYATYQYGNLKITDNNGHILHWWKLSFTIPAEYKDTLDSIFASDELMYNDYLLFLDKYILPGDNVAFLDEGYNDEDFYSLWYPIAFMFSSVINFSQSILDVKGNIDIVKLFLESKNIALNVSNTDEELIYIYKQWVDEISKRGSKKVYRKKQLNKGFVKKLNNQKALKFFTSQVSSSELELNFTCKVSTNVKFTIFDNFDFEKIGNDWSITFHYLDSSSANQSLQKSFTYNPNSVLNIKIFITSNKTFLVLFDENVVINTQISDIDLSQNLQVTTVIHTNNETVSTNFIEISYFKFNNILLTIIFKFNFWNIIVDSDVSQNLLLDIFSYDYVNDAFINLNTIDDDFENIDYSFVDGELLRLIDHSEDDEFLLALVRDTYLGQTNGISSFSSRQSYPIENFNKFYCPEKYYSTLHGLPLIIGKRSLVSIESQSIKFTTQANILTGLKASLIDQKIILDPLIDYEYSLRVKFSASMILNFGGIFYDLNDQPIIVIRKATDDSTFNDQNAYLFSDTIPNYWINQWVWIRGVIRNSDFVANANEQLNLKIGQNIVMTQEVKYFLPEITFQSINDNDTILINDIQIRPLQLPILKGALASKNIGFLFMKNNSGRNIDMIQEKIISDFLPYNLNTIIKTI